ncbi:hypothetical protein BJ508DRAFT_325605 [Ascobolus immersus RN42]|uniref:C2H2-type domain-containing protein n=1 Tax=Ascobolus immersus RN42 TaxID=1160509 RepID=A0A3N4I8E3_ASCIM|nr:hypothetical protein BJ508DRAFT_325605 [Ascobolus immersus RN42]
MTYNYNYTTSGSAYPPTYPTTSGMEFGGYPATGAEDIPISDGVYFDSIPRSGAQHETIDGFALASTSIGEPVMQATAYDSLPYHHYSVPNAPDTQALAYSMAIGMPQQFTTQTPVYPAPTGFADFIPAVSSLATASVMDGGSQIGIPSGAVEYQSAASPATADRPCPRCGVMIRRGHDLQRHIREQHTPDGATKYQCGVCGHTSKRRAQLEDHQRRRGHQGIQSITFEVPTSQQ